MPKVGELSEAGDAGSVSDETTETPARDTPQKGGPSSPHAWVASPYFAEGYPYSIVHQVADVLYKELGASLQVIGLTSLFHLPWNLKFLWGPLLDAFGTKRQWLLATEVVCAVGIFALALGASFGASLTVFSLVFGLLAITSATHDIAIDGYYLEALDERQQSLFVGYRASAYKVAMLLVSGPLLMLVGGVGWGVGLGVGGAVMLGLLAYHAIFLPRVEVADRPLMAMFAALKRPRILAGTLMTLGVFGGLVVGLRSEAWANLWGEVTSRVPLLGKISVGGWIGLLLLAGLVALLVAVRRLTDADRVQDAGFYKRAFVRFLDQPGVGRILAFVVLFRVGESLLVKMRYPFLSDLGMTVEQYGFANGTMGILASFAGTLVGGWLIARDGLRRWIWPFVLLQNVLNLAFAALAWWLLGWGGTGAPTGEAGLTLLTTIISLESLGSGLGTAVFMVYLMRCCRPEFKAAHMAIVTALMSVGFTVAGVGSGFAAEAMGYTVYFGVSFLATIPGMALIFFIPHLDGREQEPGEATA